MSSQQPHKLLQFEAKPPAEMWAAIEAELDQRATLPTLEKLAIFEATPPFQVWEQIERSFDTIPETEKVVTFKKYGWMRYAAAAVILMALAYTVITYGLQREDKNLATQQHNNSIETSPSDKTTVNTNKGNKDQGASHPTSPLSNTQSTRETEDTKKKTTTPSKRYMTLAMDNGETVRLSKKVLPVFECADNATANIRKRCKENIENLQQKMASSLASPTTDFAGLIDMIKTLEEN